MKKSKQIKIDITDPEGIVQLLNIVNEDMVKVPDGIDLEIVACLMTKGLTTFYLLHKTYPVE